MEAQAKLFAAEFNIQKPVDDITDMEWMAYFQIGLEHVHTQYADIALKIKKSMVMNEKEMDAEKRMDRWIRDYWQILTKNHMLDYGKRHPKAAVKALLEGVRPEGLRESLRQELEHDMKYLRNDVVEFFNYVRSELRHTLKYLRASGQAGYKDREQKVKALKAQEKAKNQNPNGRDAKNVNRDVEKNKRKPVCCEAEKDAIAKKKLAEWRAQENARAERSKSKVLHSVPTNRYDTGEFLVQANQKRSTWNLGAIHAEDMVLGTAVQKALKWYKGEEDPDEDSDDSDEDDDPPIGNDKSCVWNILDSKLKEAAKQGLSNEGMAKLKEILATHIDIFRVNFCGDSPVNVPPLE
ncbi:unnamed protein product, partial [Aphanomyces euteiches]